MNNCKLFFLTALLALSISYIGCGKTPTCQYATVPNSLLLQFKRNGNVLPDSILKNVKLSYISNGNKTYVSDFTIAVDGNYLSKGFMGTRNIGTISNGDINTFYIEYGNGWSVDSLYVHYIAPSPSTNCIYVVTPVKFNNQLAPIDTSYHFDTPIYVLNKL